MRPDGPTWTAGHAWDEVRVLSPPSGLKLEGGSLPGHAAKYIVKNFRGPCAARCKPLAPCCCVSADGEAIFGCVPTDLEYFLPACLHMALCPQLGCDPRGGDMNWDCKSQCFLTLVSNFFVCCWQDMSDGAAIVNDAKVYEKWLITLLTQLDWKSVSLPPELLSWWANKQRYIKEAEEYRLKVIRKNQLKESALSKLTQEEKEVLGLKG